MEKIKYVCLIIFFNFYLSSPANSEIVYSGIINLNGPNFNIDFDKNGTIDFITKWHQLAFGYNGYAVSGFDVEFNRDVYFINNEQGGIFEGRGLPGAKSPLESGEIIGPVPPQKMLWSRDSNTEMLTTIYNMSHDLSHGLIKTYSGTWYNVSEKYLGFKMNIDSNLHYGWVRLSTDTSNKVKLVDYAYEDVPGAPIVTGANSGGASSVSVPLPSVLHLLLRK